MTIYEIKRRVESKGSHYFSRSSMKFFGQTLKDFSVRKISEHEYIITAPIYHQGKRVAGVVSQKIFDSISNELKSVNSSISK